MDLTQQIKLAQTRLHHVRNAMAEMTLALQAVPALETLVLSGASPDLLVATGMTWGRLNLLVEQLHLEVHLIANAIKAAKRAMDGR